MIKIKEIAFTAYAVSNIPKSRAFYEGVLGLTPSDEYPVKDESESEGWVEYNIGSGTLGIGCSPDFWKPSKEGASVALEVEDFDEAVAGLKEKGVKVIMGPNDFPSCNMIVVADPDGNKITLHKRKAK
jgi:predicted enzyme related to lactoylglutathione lyase